MSDWPTGSMERNNYTPGDVAFWKDAVRKLHKRNPGVFVGGMPFDCGFQYGISLGQKARRWKTADRPSIDAIEEALS